jgi:hypothetical protein
MAATALFFTFVVFMPEKIPHTAFGKWLVNRPE